MICALEAVFDPSGAAHDVLARWGSVLAALCAGCGHMELPGVVESSISVDRLSNDNKGKLLTCEFGLEFSIICLVFVLDCFEDDDLLLD